MKTIINNLRKYKEWIVVPCLLAIAAIAHAYNMFHFPFYTDDEGTYMSQAWAVLTQGKLAPYTYWYDHAPGGWLFIALWVKVTGGFFAFGDSINSGRVFMLVLHIAIVAMLYYCTKKISGSSFAAVVATLIFSLSPLGIYFQRLVLLDNMMVFWLFSSLTILLRDKVKLSHVMISGLFFGVAVLTKESAIVFFPAFIFAIYAADNLPRKSFVIVKWLATSFSVISIYILYALLKSEFFPPGFLGDFTQHVSLVGSFIYQATRGNHLPFWNSNSDFHAVLLEALARDPFSVIFGIISLFAAILLSVRIKSFRIPALFSIWYLIFLMRGSLTINFYLIPLLPFLAICDGLFLAYIFRKVSSKKSFVYGILCILAILGMGFAYSRLSTLQYTKDETTSQTEAIQWVKDNVDPNSYIAIGDYAYVDLHAQRSPGDAVFPHADWFWKIANDPSLQYGTVHQPDYLLVGLEMLEQVRENNAAVVKSALAHATPVATWTKGSSSYFDLKDYISTNGDWEIIYKMDTADEIQLQNSWQYYKAHFIQPEGNVIDASQGNITTSEGQSYAMLRAVIVGDESAFNNSWTWTQNHLEYRQGDKLFSWLWKKDPSAGVYKVEDSNAATDADQDIALSLVLASQKWNDPAYLTQAQAIINDIWDKEIVNIDGHYYVASSQSSETPDGLLVDPSYISPATYKIFALVDPAHPWNALVSDSYAFLNELADRPGNTSHLPPNQILVTSNGSLKSASKYAGSNSDDYGFDAFRTLWRVALDATWFNDPQAQEYLAKVTPFFLAKQSKGQLPGMIIDLKGNDLTSPDSLSTDGGMVAALFITNKTAADTLYSSIYTNSYNSAGYWGDPTNYYSQNWAWLTDALYTGQIFLPFPQSAFSGNETSTVIIPDYNQSDLAPLITPATSTQVHAATEPIPVIVAATSSPITPPPTPPTPAATPTPVSVNPDISLPYSVNSFVSGDGWDRRWGMFSINNGALTIGSDSGNTSGGTFLTGSTSWTDYTLKADVQWIKGQEFSLIARRSDDADLIRCDFSNLDSSVVNISINRTFNNQTVLMGDGRIYVNNAAHIQEDDIKVSMSVNGDNVECSIDGSTVSQNVNRGLQPPLLVGGIGFETWDPTANNSQITVTNVSVGPQ